MSSTRPASRKRKRKELPPWAETLKPHLEDRRREPLSLEKEEEYLRLRANRRLRRHLDEALDSMLNKHIAEPFQQQLQSLLSMVQESDGDKKVPAQQNSTFSLSTFLLPLLVLHGPFNLEDRGSIMRKLVSSTRRSRPRSCVVWLEPTHRNWKREVIDQCVSQEPVKLHSSKHYRMVDIITTWAEQSEQFDDVIVFWHVDSSAFYSRQFASFLDWCATELREQHGLPISLVLFNVQDGRLKLEAPLSGTCYATGSLLRRDFVLPTAKRLLDDTYLTVYSQYKFPLAIPEDVEERMMLKFLHQTGSVVHYIHMFKGWLSHYFSYPGTSIVVSGDKKWHRWLLLDDDARELAFEEKSIAELMEWSKKHEILRQQASLAIHIKHVLKQFDLGADSIPGQQQEKSTALTREAKLETMRLLKRVRVSISKDSCRVESPLGSKFDVGLELRDNVNELIILISESTSMEYALMSCDYIIDALRTHTRDLSAGVDEAMSALACEPRRRAVKSLVCVDEADHPLLRATGAIFGLLESVMTITSHEWYNLYKDTFAIELGNAEALRVFGYAVHHLKRIGLIKEKENKRGTETVYERSRLVWTM